MPPLTTTLATRMIRPFLRSVPVALLLATAAATGRAQPTSRAAASGPAGGAPAANAALVERLLSRVVSEGGAGCSIGILEGDARVVRTAGLADLERAVPLSEESILEAGSVSKQVTAAAVLLLALDGQLELDDDARRWLPELPVYGAPITVRHLLTHTSGLRDWGAITALEGWPRGDRAHTNRHVLQVASRQRALNYAPGATYSYTNTGYNLLAVLVERVSGRSLAEFTRERLFVPLGMTSTSWRDDHHRVVPGRALAYGAGRTPSLAMPDESAYGNGGLLTTAGDLLRWVEALNQQELGGAFADSMRQRMMVTNGDTIDYALGVNVLSHRGTPELSHSGSTGGYRAHLLHFPERRAGVAVLCNGAGFNATQLAEQLADSVIGSRTRRVAGAGERVVRPVMAAASWASAPRAEYTQLAGRYASDEVGGEPYVVALEGDTLVLRQAPDTRFVLTAARGAIFAAGGRQLWFERGPDGRAIALHVAQDRAWDVRFPLIGTPQ